MFTVWGEDSAALAGLVVPLLGVFFPHRLAMPILDGVASILIGGILVIVASFLAFESRDLIIGGVRPSRNGRGCSRGATERNGSGKGGTPAHDTPGT